VADHGPSLTEICRHWTIARSPARKSIAKMEGALKEFEALVDKLGCKAITADHVQQFKDYLTDKHQNYKTRSVKLDKMRTLLRFAKSNRVITVDPCEGIKIGSPKNMRKARLPYTEEQLRSVFTSPVYVSDFWPKGGAEEASYWLPLLALEPDPKLSWVVSAG